MEVNPRKVFERMFGRVMRGLKVGQTLSPANQIFGAFLGLGPLLLASLALTAPNATLVDAVKSGDNAGILALLDSYADVNAPEPDGTTALAWATRMDDLNLVGRLLRAGANVNAANRYGVTPLNLACVSGKPRVD